MVLPVMKKALGAGALGPGIAEQLLQMIIFSEGKQNTQTKRETLVFYPPPRVMTVQPTEHKHKIGESSEISKRAFRGCLVVGRSSLPKARPMPYEGVENVMNCSARSPLLNISFLVPDTRVK